MKEKKLLTIILDCLDICQDKFPQWRDVTLENLADIYHTDLTDIINLFLEYTWSFQDETDGLTVLEKFLIARGE